MKKYFSLLLIISLLMVFFIPVLKIKAATVLSEENNNDIFVAPYGDDGNSGTKELPLKTLFDAKEKLNSYIGTVNEPVTVWLREGTYVLSETLNFTAEDFSEVTFKAYNSESVKISGAKEVTGFTEDTVNGVRCFVSQLDTSKDNWCFKSLFNNKTSLETPKYPEKGYFKVKSLNTDDSIWTTENSPWQLTTGQRSFNADLADVSKKFYNQDDVIVRILHYWHDEMMYISGFDETTGRVSLSRPSSMSIRDIDRYFFDNVFEALNSPGEWYLDKATGKLYYIPQENEQTEGFTLYGSSLEQLVIINGVSGISFEGIIFENTDWNITTPSNDTWSSWLAEYNVDALQAALDVKGVISVTDASDIHFKNCDFVNLGATAIKLLSGVTDSSIESCYFENIAATGIYAGGANVSVGEAGSTNNITITNNEIYKYGRRFFCAIGIHITYCNTADVSNNVIHDGFYTGISCGWVWGYTFSATRDISIKNNYIYNIGQGWLSDMGGIYMLGKQPGTVLSGNVIHNVAADESEGGYGGWGIYLDEGSSEMLIEKNLVYCCGSQGLNIHYGKGNVFRNNISALNAQGAVSPGLREEEHATAFYYNNIFLTDNGAPIYIYMQDTSHFYDNGNLMWDLSSGSELYFCKDGSLKQAVTLEKAIKEDFIHNVKTEDPLFADAKNFNFTLSENSPALAMGFEAWNYSEAGNIKESTVGSSRTAAVFAAADVSAAVALSTSSVPFPLADLLIVFVMLIVVAIVYVMIKAGNESVVKEKMLFFSLSALVLMGVTSYFLFVNFIEWNQTVYAVTSVMLCILSGVPIALLRSSKQKSAKMKPIVKYIIAVAVYAAAFYAIIYLFNNVLRTGAAVACVGVFLLTAIYELIVCILTTRTKV